jgi:glycosyltransferase involved in cell wall biosynthesis
LQRRARGLETGLASGDAEGDNAGAATMRILLLTQKLPLPLEDGYNLRIDHYARRLGERHELHLVSLDQGELPARLDRAFASVRLLPVRAVPKAPTPVHRLFQAFSPDHLYDQDPEVRFAVEQEVARREFDVLWVSGWRMLPYLSDLPRGRPALLADVIDEGAREAWVELRRARSLGQGLRRWKAFLQCRGFERRYFGSADLCAFVSEADAAATEMLCPGLATSVVHNGVDADYYAPQVIEESGPSLVFEGGMTHPPNVEGIVHFCRSILPLVRAELPDTRLSIVGKDPLPAVRALAGPGVEVTGFVPDVRPDRARSNVLVSPLIGGAGIKNKILQAWSMERAVVSTSVSCGGLEVRPDENLVLADGPRDFAQACLRLLRDPEERRRLGRAGRETVLERYTWDAKARDLEAVLARAVQIRGAAHDERAREGF